MKLLATRVSIARLAVVGVMAQVLAGASGGASAAPAARSNSTIPPVYVHYMAWFQANPTAHKWGWHWTMGHYDPSVQTDGLPQIASHYHPQIGPYDSGARALIMYQIMLMKMTGIQGVIIDWYGKDNLYDYASINRNVSTLVPLLQQAGLKFALCYEDHTIPQEIKAGLFPAGAAIHHVQQLMSWLQSNYFKSSAYIKYDGRPLLLSFGTPYFDNAEWNEIFSVLKTPPVYVTESDRREPTAASGGFDWPIPAGGTAAALEQQKSFLARSRHWPIAIAAAFPGFNDIYAQAGVGRSWGHIAEDNGSTLKHTLDRALHSGATAVQVVTWNDWGEGTQIEPSIEQGTRDLKIIRAALVRGDNGLTKWRDDDLQLPAMWYELRKQLSGQSVKGRLLVQVYNEIIRGKMTTARALLHHLWSNNRKLKKSP